ncbi:class I adenylate-forming enzyme family protein [Sphingomonas sp. SUN039]|uniref:class I adenylate-forming enzyme family protein n=1 Tax=Sphingomonas sp. SUN039 TaxID=2937787 RepID=UPI00216426E9|nr:class I adenylate-forming enzyme family protein [Sphingomonas sp. SUN039]UVO53608.1 acyl--CoA ligase [Sphingomonas sp. SUN039]
MTESDATTGVGHRPNVRDPLADRLIGPDRAFELIDTRIGNATVPVFKDAPRTLAALYRQGMAFGSRPMIVQDDVELTFDEVFSKAAALADALQHRFDVTHGTKVAVVASNRPEWIVALIAVTAAGGIAALVNSRGAAEEMLRAIAAVGCEVAIVDAALANAIAVEAPDPGFRRIVIGTPDAPLRPGRDGDFDSLIAKPRAFSPIDMDPADGAVILFTSGTTGFPKGALLSHGAIAHSVSLSRFMGTLQDIRYDEETGKTLSSDRRSMATPTVILGPMFHLSGMVPIFRSVSVGTAIHIMGKWNVDIAFDMIERVGMTRLSFVPAMLWDMLRSPRATPEMLGKVCYMANGAAALNPALLAEIRARMPDCLMSNTYGQTETTAWTCTISGRAYLDNPASCGWACPTVDVQVRRDDGSAAEIGEPGELWVRSAGLMTEYVGDPAATAEALHDGWLASGDVGIEDANGIFTIVDRKKNMVISGGENIYCAEVERVLSDHPQVRDAIAYGLPDERLGERLVATVVVETASMVSEDELKTYCRGRLAIYKVPRSIAVSPDPLPRTASGKVDRGTFLKARQAKR